MPVITVTPSDSDVFLALWTFLRAVLPGGDAVFTGSIVGDQLTASAITTGTIAVGNAVLGLDVAYGTVIVSDDGGGAYTIAPAQDDAQDPRIMSTGVEVLQAQPNRVPEPKASDFVLMTILRMPRLSTNLDEYDTVAGTKSMTQSGQWSIQLDLHGPNSADFAQIVSTLFRDEYAVEIFAELSSAISPLYADDPRQMPFINSEQQLENRYVVEANLQVNQTVTVSQQFADTLTVGIVNIETPPNSWPNSSVTVSTEDLT